MLGARLIAALLGAALGMVAVLMLIAPAHWYATFPGVAASGPLNEHFVRDLGCAFLVSAGCYLAAAAFPVGAPNLIRVATAFVSLHAGVHLFELFGSSHGGGQSSIAILAIYVPPLAGAACLWLLRSKSRLDRAG